MTVTTWGINSLPSKDIASGSAIGSTLRQIAGSIGTTVFMTIISKINILCIVSLWMIVNLIHC